MFSLPFSVGRSTTINKPIDFIFSNVSDFNTWIHWSPWICQEPTCSVQIKNAPKKVGHYQSWDGQRIGQGEMEITSIIPNEKVEYDLNFIKPWKSKSKVQFEFKKINDNETQVIWKMQGTLPLFLFFLKNMMSAWVGGDYERGLSMLKEYLENGEVITQTEVKGESEFDGFYYIGKHRTCDTKEIGAKMEEDFKDMTQMLNEGQLPRPDSVLSFYHKFDLVNGKCEYTSGFAYKKPIENHPSDLKIGKVDNHKALKVEHTGPYRHLGNAWSTAMGLQRHLKKKALKSVPMYEIYISNPQEVAEKDLVTEVIIPVR